MTHRYSRLKPAAANHSHVIPVVVLLLLTVLAAPGFAAAEEGAAAPLELEYHLRLAQPTVHLLEVEIVASKVTEPALDFVMPAWAPGRYAIYDFAKNVQEFEAVGARGQRLPWSKIDKQTWRVEARDAAGSVQARYRVFANDLSGSFSQFDASHANLNGASVFMYIAGHKPDPLTLTVVAPPKWQLISGLSASATERSFRVPNYDLLVDTPLEVSPECALEQFQERGKTIRVAVHSYDEEDTDRSRLLDGLKKIVHSMMAAMPEPDFPHYTFIFHFAPDIALGDGMEHLNSTQVIVRGTLRDGVAEALETAAHEFFHVWNVKRLRPAALGPFDYTRENYSRSLWFAEGVTTYAAYLHLLRSGVWSREQFLQRLGDEIRTLEWEPGRALMSAESSSFHAWFYDRSPQMQETNFANATISYYNKGLLLGVLLDLEIRSRTLGAKSLQDVLVTMFRRFYDAPPASYYGPGRGYEEKHILEAVNVVSGSDFTSFFERYVRGTEPLPYAETLALPGLRLSVGVAPGTPPSIGVLIQPDNRGARIVAVRPGGAAERAGLSRDDLLISVDDQSLATQELKERLKIYPPGTVVPFMVERHGRREIISVTLDPPLPNAYAIEDLPRATPAQVGVREAWLGSKD
jgi:predicted metalloprotease with PDZ domain